MKGSRHIKSVILRIKNVEKWLFSTSFIQKLVSTRTKTSVVYFLQLISSLVGWWSKPGDRLLLPYSLAFKLPISLGSSANCIARKWSAELAREKREIKAKLFTVISLPSLHELPNIAQGVSLKCQGTSTMLTKWFCCLCKCWPSKTEIIGYPGLDMIPVVPSSGCPYTPSLAITSMWIVSTLE